MTEGKKMEIKSKYRRLWIIERKFSYDSDIIEGDRSLRRRYYEIRNLDTHIYIRWDHRLGPIA
jgi:hypothetical protein